MDKNLFALVANGLYTVGVKFQQLDAQTRVMGFNSNKSYTYVTDIELAVGDLVVVEVGNVPEQANLKVAMVVEIDEGVTIEPKSEIAYKFVVSKLDTKQYDALLARKDEVERELAKAYQINLRKQFAQQFLGGADETMMKKLGYE